MKSVTSLVKKNTSRERPQSAPYLRLKKAKGLQCIKYSLLQYPREEKLKMPKIFEFFDFVWSPVSRIVPKNVKWGISEYFEHTFFCKREKIKGALWRHLKNLRKKVSKTKKPAQKNFGQERDSNPRPSTWQTSKNRNLYAK